MVAVGVALAVSVGVRVAVAVAVGVWVAVLVAVTVCVAVGDVVTVCVTVGVAVGLRGSTTTSSRLGPTHPLVVLVNVKRVVAPDAMKINVCSVNPWFPAGTAAGFGVKVKVGEVTDPAVTTRVLGSLPVQVAAAAGKPDSQKDRRYC
jgi:hypothetical protein